MGKPTPGALFQGYSKEEGTDVEAIRARFMRRYGHAPAEVHDAGSVWLAGPVSAEPVTDEGKLSDIISWMVGDGDQEQQDVGEQLELWEGMAGW
jgi:hypothetical protein